MDDNDSKYCPECQVGVFHSDGATYYTWIDDELITVPNFPCWVCDVCGHRDWDHSALMQLNILLSPNAGQPKQPRSARPVTTGEKESAAGRKTARGRRAY